MSEIISIEGSKAKIGLDSGKIITVPIAAIGYAAPKAGDQVKVYKDGDETIIKKTRSQSDDRPTQVIQINNGHAATKSRPDTSVNKAIYIVLTITLGWLGVHRFMRGQVGIGILYLLTFGLLLWGVIVDLIIGLSKLKKYDDEDFVFTDSGRWA